MYEIEVTAQFNAAHRLRGYRGKCENLHGHNWKVSVSVKSQRLDKTGMVLDFKELKQKINSIIDKLDHSYLNNLEFFRKNNPTSENIARYIYDSIIRKIKKSVYKISKVTVWETDTCGASFSPDV